MRTSKTAAEPKFFTVPAGTPSRLCKGPTCGQRVYWIQTPKGRRMPVDCDVDGGVRPTALHDPRQLDAFGTEVVVRHDGRGRSHFETCKDAAKFRGD